MISVEVGMSSYRVQHFDLKAYDERLREQLDLLEERKREVEVQTMSNKGKAKQYSIMQVRPRSFKECNLVLKQTGVTTQEEGKLRLQWVGPFVVKAINQPGSYRLKDDKGKELPHPWNTEHLNKYFL